jgi:hypothetical protein
MYRILQKILQNRLSRCAPGTAAHTCRPAPIRKVARFVFRLFWWAQGKDVKAREGHVKAREGRQGKGMEARQGKGSKAREGRQGKGWAAI